MRIRIREEVLEDTKRILPAILYVEGNGQNLEFTE